MEQFNETEWQTDPKTGRRYKRVGNCIEYEMEIHTNGAVSLGDGGVELVATAGVVALELVVDLGGGAELLLQAVRSHKGRGTVHLVKLFDLRGDLNEARVVVQFLLDKVFAENGSEVRLGHRLHSSGVDEGSGLILHIGADVIPRLGHLVFFEINLVRDHFFFFAHGI